MKNKRIKLDVAPSFYLCGDFFHYQKNDYSVNPGGDKHNHKYYSIGVGAGIAGGLRFSLTDRIAIGINGFIALNAVNFEYSHKHIDYSFNYVDPISYQPTTMTVSDVLIDSKVNFLPGIRGIATIALVITPKH